MRLDAASRRATASRVRRRGRRVGVGAGRAPGARGKRSEGGGQQSGCSLRDSSSEHRGRRFSRDAIINAYPSAKSVPYAITSNDQRRRDANRGPPIPPMSSHGDDGRAARRWRLGASRQRVETRRSGQGPAIHVCRTGGVDVWIKRGVRSRPCALGIWARSISFLGAHLPWPIAVWAFGQGGSRAPPRREAYGGGGLRQTRQ